MTDPTRPRCYALVPCAGFGARAGRGAPKQYTLLAGRALVRHTLDALAAVRRIERVLVVLSPDDAQFETRVPGFDGWVARCGGATRAATVRAGLDVLRERGAHEDDWVLVHDAARCLLRAEWADALIDACLVDAVGGLLALPLADTLKRESVGRVAATVDRHALWLAQTPQMFRLALLRDALDAAGEQVTDEASAIEATGREPLLVAGALENFKLTWPADFELADRLLRSRS